MANQINLSRNELWALLSKVFEALYGHRRDYFDMARIVLWLECHGHHGIKRLVSALPVLGNRALPEPSLAEISSSEFVIDGGGRSLLELGPLLSDLAIAFAAENGDCKIDMINVSSSDSLLGALTFIARREYHGIAISPNNISFITPRSGGPTIYEKLGESNLSLACARDPIKISNFIDDNCLQTKTIPMQTEFFSDVLENGIIIPISEVEILKNVASRILVEATEASRRGAGE